MDFQSIVVELMMIGGLVYFLPWLAGLDRKEITGYYSAMHRYFHRTPTPKKMLIKVI